MIMYPQQTTETSVSSVAPVMGIDPGQKGGVAFVSSTTAIALPMPHRRNGDLDVVGLMELIRINQPRHIVIEHQWGQRVQGIKSSGIMMFNYGKLRATIELYGPRQLTVVNPKDWQRVIIPDTPKGETKQASIREALKAYPDLNLLASPRCRKEHDGMADATNLARYVL